jgi:CubicO group peptidase (beta-lactamase class C family)
MATVLPKLTLFTIAAITTAITATAQHTGSILFTGTEKKATGIKEQDIQTAATLTPNTNLFITVFLEKPLTRSLQELAPTLSADSLSRVGNYQFSFMVDNRVIYQTALMPGAPQPMQQQTDTAWSKPLIDNEHEGAWWSQYAWNRFMYNGGDSALTDGKHLLKIILRPYVKTPTLVVGNIIAEGQLELTVKRKLEIDPQHIQLSPIKPYNGLPVSKESFDRDKIKMLKGHVAGNTFRHITSIVALKNGKILLEEYFNGSARDSLHDVRSVGKSFASTLLGMAIRDKYLRTVQQTLNEFYDGKDYRNYSPAKERVTLRELLTMSSRFNGDDDDMDSPGNEENMYPTDNWVKFTLNLPLDTVKYHGQWHYFTAGVMLLGSILDKIIPGGLEKYADANLFKQLGITRYQWVYTPQHVPSTAGGIRMKALDFAKYGQLYANAGRWNNRQVVPKEWVNETLSHQLPITGRENEYYGYLFWNKTFHSDGKAYEAYYCSGNGGNKIYILKDQPLVVVITATAYGQSYAHAQVERMMEEYILPAVLGH